MRKMRKTGSMTALAVVLALGACSTVEDSWDYVFSDDSAPDVATPAQGPATAEGEAEAGAATAQAPIPQGLRGDPQPPDYGPGTRRQPISTRSLVDEAAPAAQRSVVESVSPAASSPDVVQTAELAPLPAAPAPRPERTVQAPPAAPPAAPVAAAPAAAVPPAPPAVVAAPAPPAVARTPVQAPVQAPAPAPASVQAPAPVQAPTPVQARVAPPPAPTIQPVAPLVPTTPAGEVYASQPLAGDVAPRLRPPPGPGRFQSATAPSDQLLINPQGGVGGMSMGADDLGTTVIGGDGRILSQPDAPMAHPMLTPDSYGFDMGDPTLPVMMSGAETLVATIQFGRGSASLSANERSLLRQVVQIQRQSGGVLQVVGHASSQTADMSMDRHMLVNYTTSARRAEAVAAELRRLGAPREAVLVVAQSDNAPIYREIMPSGEAGNRRAEIYLVN